MRWRPMQDAPRDGRFVELRATSGRQCFPFRVCIARYDGGHEIEGRTAIFNDLNCWRDVDGQPLMFIPIDWRPVS